MIKAKFLGVDNGILKSGKDYEIKAYCVICDGKPKLRVIYGKQIKYKAHYESLEEFLKSWRVKGVYRG